MYSINYSIDFDWRLRTIFLIPFVPWNLIVIDSVIILIMIYLISLFLWLIVEKVGYQVVKYV